MHSLLQTARQSSVVEPAWSASFMFIRVLFNLSVQGDDEKNTVVLLGNKHKESSTFLPDEGTSEGRWVLQLPNGAWTQQEE